MPGMIECHNHLSIDATIPEHLELLAWSTECELTLIALDGFRKRSDERSHNSTLHGRPFLY